jgi:Flp pilus assembly pilin Flp
VSEDKGQDLIEYGLLLGIIGVSAILLMPTIQNKMATAFQGWGAQVHDNLWVPQPPVAP